jgi:FAD/FMN-containing dehydrogenase
MSAAEREKFRDFRHAIALIVNDTARQNGFPKLATDQAVPVERIGELLAFYYRELRALFGDCDPPRYAVYGHIGDAHLHVNILPQSEDDVARGQELMLDFARKAVSLGGTVAAEHGVGKRKAHLLEVMYTPAQLEAMRDVKRRFDPQFLLGRGNLFPV